MGLQPGVFLAVQAQKKLPGETALHKHLEVLASDELAGRKPGTAGDSLAALYIRNQFQQAGLTLLGNKGYQPFQLVTQVKSGTHNALSLNEIQWTMGKDFTPIGFTANATVEARVVFAGFGFQIAEPDLQWNDYASLDAKGKWVMALRMDPDLDNPQSRYAAYSDDRYKVMTAADQGAAGLLLVSTTDYDPKDELERLRFDQSVRAASIPVIQITRKVANKILAADGLTIEALQNKMVAEKKSASQQLSPALKGTADVEPSRVGTQNVIAYRKGKQKTEQTLVIGAHYDHLGMGGSGSRKPDTMAVHNGADDNASGVAVLLELARRIGKKPLDCNVLFVAFGAEEMGLVGSRYYVANPLLPLKQTKAMINLDMVGRLNANRYLSIGGTGTASQMDSLVTALTQPFQFDLRKTTEGTGPSDHSSFYVEGIPVLFVTTGVHEQYHTPEDDIHLIQFEGMAQIANLTHRLAESMGSKNQKLQYTEAGVKQNAPARRRLKVTLGLVPDMSSDVKGLRLDGVRPGGPAQLSGMQKGDVIVSFDSQPVTNIYDYMYRLAKFEKGQRVNVEVVRGDEKKIFIVDL